MAWISCSISQFAPRFHSKYSSQLFSLASPLQWVVSLPPYTTPNPIYINLTQLYHFELLVIQIFVWSDKNSCKVVIKLIWLNIHVGHHYPREQSQISWFLPEAFIIIQYVANFIAQWWIVEYSSWNFQLKFLNSFNYATALDLYSIDVNVSDFNVFHIIWWSL